MFLLKKLRIVQPWLVRMAQSEFFLLETRSGSALFAMGEDVDGDDKDASAQSDWGKLTYIKAWKNRKQNHHHVWDFAQLIFLGMILDQIQTSTEKPLGTQAIGSGSPRNSFEKRSNEKRILGWSKNYSKNLVIPKSQEFLWLVYLVSSHKNCHFATSPLLTGGTPRIKDQKGNPSKVSKSQSFQERGAVRSSFITLIEHQHQEGMTAGGYQYGRF